MAGSDNTLYLYTSLTAGSSHIITATSRLETILKANRIPFQAIDIATDDVSRRLWGRYSKGRKLPGLVKYKTIIGDLEQIEDWNEYGELKDQISSIRDPDDFSSDPPQKQVETEPLVPKSAPAFSNTTSRSSTPHVQIQNPPVSEPKEDQRTLALRLAGEEAAAKAKENARSKLGAKPPTTEAEGKAPPKSDPKPKGTEAISETAGKSTAAAAEEEKKEEKAKVEEEKQSSGRRSSVAPEIIPPLKRPSLADETAAVSSANFHADNAEILGLVGHHRGSIISATTHDEQEQVRNDIRASISEAPADGDIEALRKTAAEGKNADTILEDEAEDESESESESASDEDEEEVKKEKEEVKKEEEEVTKEEKKKEEEQEKEKEKEQAAEEKTEPAAPAETDDTQKQDPKDESKAGVSVED